MDRKNTSTTSFFFSCMVTTRNYVNTCFDSNSATRTVVPSIKYEVYGHNSQSIDLELPACCRPPIE